MTYAKKIRLYCGLVTVVCAASLGITSSAAANKYAEATSPSAAHARVVSLTKQLRTARYVEDKTIIYSHAYGTPVGRWVQLALQVGWKKSSLGGLMAVVYRESRGNPQARNPSSGAAGLLQFMPQWYTGQWSFPAFDPYNPKVNLKMGLRLYKQQGWTPWSL